MITKPVKVVATIGPATYSEQTISSLAIAGVDVFRINFSHADEESTVRMINWIRETEKKLQRPLSIMMDLPGPKIRISDMAPDVKVEKGQQYTISKDVDYGNDTHCGLNYPSIIDDLQVGAEVFIDEGTIRLRIDEKNDREIVTTVLVGGTLKPKKGFSAEGISFKSDGLTPRDKEGIRIGLENHVDAFAVSFVQDKDDVELVRDMLPKDDPKILVAKIETADGVKNAEHILESADAMMVARGDLGLAVPLSQVPHIQKKLIALCVRKAKPVITATQMLESMITKPVPTRAEVTDVANAILDHTDAVMLSAETAMGSFPLETVEMMSKIIQESANHIQPYEFAEQATMSTATCDSVGAVADRVGAKLVIAFTQSGMTAKRIAQHRHSQPILAVTPDPAIMHGLNFAWGVHPQEITLTKDFDDLLVQARELAQINTLNPLKEGDYYIVSAGIPFGKSGSTNMVLVQKV